MNHFTTHVSISFSQFVPCNLPPTTLILFLPPLLQTLQFFFFALSLLSAPTSFVFLPLSNHGSEDSPVPLISIFNAHFAINAAADWVIFGRPQSDMMKTWCKIYILKLIHCSKLDIMKMQMVFAIGQGKERQRRMIKRALLRRKEDNKDITVGQRENWGWECFCV